MALDYDQFRISVDLLKESQRYLIFLSQIEKQANLLSKDHIIRNAVRRYETIWLPLLRNYGNEDLQPPIDVHWAWAVHMLCPKAYAKDCEKILSKVPNHHFFGDNDRGCRALDTAREIWGKTNPDEPFDVNYTDIPYDQTLYKTQLKYDIVSASTRQMKFFYHVSLPHFSLVTFLEKGLDRYMKFVSLKKSNPDNFLVPMYDVDLIWHAHQLRPTEYKADTTKFLGYVLNHDDSTTDREPGSKLSVGDDKTRKIWQEVYHEPFPIPGVMNRGEHPKGRLHNIEKEELDNLFPKVYSVRVEKVLVTGNVKEKYRLGGTISVSHMRGSDINLGTKKELPFEWISSGKNALLLFDVDSRHDVKLNLNIERRDGVKGALFGKTFFSAQFIVNQKHIDHNEESKSSKNFKLSKESANGVKATVTLSVVRVRSVDARFLLQKGGFSPSVMPDNAPHTWGPVPLPKLPPNTTNLCNVASHIITDRQAEEAFTARVIHSPPMNTTVLQIFQGDHMVVIGHLIGPEQLPSKEQMNESADKCITLNPQIGERAMLFKNAQGDWGVLKAVWTAYKKGEPPKVRGQTGHRGDPGYLTLSFYNLKHDTVKDATLLNRYRPGGARNRKFKLEHVTVNVNKGDMIIDGACRDVAENLALGLAVSIMFVLCEPRMQPPGIYPERKRGSVNPPRNSIKRRGSVLLQSLNSNSVYFFVAAGYNVETASNSWLFWQWHRRQHENDIDFDFDEEDDMLEEMTRCTGEQHDNALFCPWNPEGLPHGMDASGCGGCGGCAASCGGTGATCGISTACGGGPPGSADEDDDSVGPLDSKK